jgi:hypothetical protein
MHPSSCRDSHQSRSPTLPPPASSCWIRPTHCSALSRRPLADLILPHCSSAAARLRALFHRVPEGRPRGQLDHASLQLRIALPRCAIRPS